MVFQLSVIEPIRKDVVEARNAMNMGDYPGAIELLGKAIEVTRMNKIVFKLMICKPKKSVCLV